MMNRRTTLFALVSLPLVMACTPAWRRPYRGPEVTRIIVQKGARRMYLMHGEQALKVYEIDLGFTPIGHKQFEGDGKTPEGVYLIDRRNEQSDFHLSLGISYPNDTDRAFAQEQKKSPGGDIFIHGGPNAASRDGRDWTAGCISVSDKEIEEIWRMVRTGTEIVILP
jgi:murein L,D-transpeptidase YafK